MTSAAMPAAAPTSTEAKTADVFVVFGITGDLAKVMIFGGIIELIFGIKAEGKSLEDITKPITATDRAPAAVPEPA